MGRDSRSVRFLVPDSRGVDHSYHDVAVVDMEDEREPMVVSTDVTNMGRPGSGSHKELTDTIR